jgi:hypothetical protein
VASLDAAVASLNDKLQKLSASVEKSRSAVAEAQELLDGESLQAEKVLERRRVALRKKEDCTLKLREIGTLPAAEVEGLQGEEAAIYMTNPATPHTLQH